MKTVTEQNKKTAAVFFDNFSLVMVLKVMKSYIGWYQTLRGVVEAVGTVI
jgi:hypothetical protein